MTKSDLPQPSIGRDSWQSSIDDLKHDLQSSIEDLKRMFTLSAMKLQKIVSHEATVTTETRISHQVTTAEAPFTPPGRLSPTGEMAGTWVTLERVLGRIDVANVHCKGKLLQLQEVSSQLEMQLEEVNRE